jgi:hypothetical protein
MRKIQVVVSETGDGKIGTTATYSFSLTFYQGVSRFPVSALPRTEKQRSTCAAEVDEPLTCATVVPSREVEGKTAFQTIKKWVSRSARKK